MITVFIDPHLVEGIRRISRIRGALMEVALALKDLGGVKPYEIQQALESLDLFWTGVVNRTKKIEDYQKHFGEESNG